MKKNEIKLGNEVARRNNLNNIFKIEKIDGEKIYIKNNENENETTITNLQKNFILINEAKDVEVKEVKNNEVKEVKNNNKSRKYLENFEVIIYDENNEIKYKFENVLIAQKELEIFSLKDLKYICNKNHIGNYSQKSKYKNFNGYRFTFNREIA